MSEYDHSLLPSSRLYWEGYIEGITGTPSYEEAASHHPNWGIGSNEAFQGWSKGWQDLLSTTETMKEEDEGPF